MQRPAGYFRDARLMSVQELRRALELAKVDYREAIEKRDLIECAVNAGLFFDWASWVPFPIEDLPEELLMHILSFLAPHELVRCCLVSRRFAAYAADDSLWLRHCRDRWRAKFDTRDALRRVEVPDPQHPRKLLYGAKEADARRQALSEAELCRYPWLFVFKRFDHQLQNQPIAYWTADKTLTIEGLGTMTWRWIQDGAYIQVEQYPYLKISRTADWGWTMENHYVIFTALTADAADAPKAAQGKRRTANRE